MKIFNFPSLPLLDPLPPSGTRPLNKKNISMCYTFLGWGNETSSVYRMPKIVQDKWGTSASYQSETRAARNYHLNSQFDAHRVSWTRTAWNHNWLNTLKSISSQHAQYAQASILKRMDKIRMHLIPTERRVSLLSREKDYKMIKCRLTRQYQIKVRSFFYLGQVIYYKRCYVYFVSIPFHRCNGAEIKRIEEIWIHYLSKTLTALSVIFQLPCAPYLTYTYSWWYHGIFDLMGKVSKKSETWRL